LILSAHLSHPSRLQPGAGFVRLSRIAAINGYSITAFALLASLILIFVQFSWLGLFAGLSVALSGSLEIQAYRKFKNEDSDGFRLASLSQILVFGSILVYSVCQWILLQPQKIDSMLSPELRQLLIDLYQIDDYILDELIVMALKLTYVSLIFASLIYQGGLLVYYQYKKRKLFNPAQSNTR
jgi:hypothetical protein